MHNLLMIGPITLWILLVYLTCLVTGFKDLDSEETNEIEQDERCAGDLQTEQLAACVDMNGAARRHEQTDVDPSGGNGATCCDE